MVSNKEAMYYKKLSDNKVQCMLCPKTCIIKEGSYGICLGRKNRKGRLVSENYGKITSVSMDPIEKKPLSFFMPGTYILSIGTFGCNFKCPFCQNHGISQEQADFIEVRPEDIVIKAKMEAEYGNIGIAYTYNEPLIWYEYVLETSKRIREEGLKNVLVTNGYINEKPLMELMPYIDAMNIDLKAFNNDFYRKLCKGSLDEVKRTIEIAAGMCHVELTTLVIPNENDNMDEIESMLEWIRNISPDIPLHFSRYFPRYKYDKAPPTPVEQLLELKKTGERYLRHIVLGNI